MQWDLAVLIDRSSISFFLVEAKLTHITRDGTTFVGRYSLVSVVTRQCVGFAGRSVLMGNRFEQSPKK